MPPHLRGRDLDVGGRRLGARGAWSHALPGHADDRGRLKTPVENRIFIAGEATADAFYGTAHGAWVEGERAAEEAFNGHELGQRAKSH